MQYYKRFEKLRKDRGLTQQYIAELLEIEKLQYDDYENGIQEMPLNYLAVLCRFYGVSSNYILGLPQNLNFPKH